MKYLKYLRYILRHKRYVMLECFTKGLIWRGLVHDCSKFLPNEFVHYANYFYGDYKSIKEFNGDIRNRYLNNGHYKENINTKFDFAWLLHQKLNRHHWQWWVLCEDSGDIKSFPIREPYLTEMICDWIGAGKAQGKISPKDDKYLETRTWWLKNNDRMELAQETRNEINRRLGVK